VANKSKGERHATIIRIPVPLYDAIVNEASKIKVSINDYLVCLLYQGYREEPGHAQLPTHERTSQEHKRIPD
jgi:hypothetical protein